MPVVLSKISIPMVLFTLGAVLIIISLLQKNNNFLDMRQIVIQHFKVFKGSPFQCFIIFGVPAMFAVATAMCQLVNEDIINNLNIVLSILISMFFAMLSILCSWGRKNDDKYNQLRKETFNAIVFESILCIVLLLISFILLFLNNYMPNLLLKSISIVIYYLSFVVALNIFVIIKRLKVLFDKQS